MRVFIDLDDVLLDTREFKNVYFKTFVKFGISTDKAKEAYAKMRQRLGIYDLKTHLEFLRENYPDLPIGKIKKAIADLYGKSGSYVFKDAKPLLEYIRKKKWVIFLISSGDPKLQKRKVKSSDLQDFFQKVHYANSDHKSRWIKKSLGEDKKDFVFIDDKKAAVEDVKKAYPQSLVIQVVRYADQEKSGLVDVIVKDLKEVKILLDKFYG